MPPRPDHPSAPAPARPRVPRFTRAEHHVHRATAALMAVCILTAGCLYLPFLAELVGRRALMVTVHEWSGILLPVPLLLGLGSRALRADLTRLNRYGPHDRQWLRAALRRRGGRLAGKFNAGQKLYAAWIAGAVLVMLGTGLLMWFTSLAPLVWRTGATFVHDWLALAVVLVIAGHVGKAVGDPESRRGLRTGSVDAQWARREHPLWEHDGNPR
ncbi:cytochrome b/b6 domain-containing protein [Streptomyces sp. NPDC127097]|uniref:cytochrome b/b6 domain-containing protein n=1 Tax=Streptomyces sp. NPDC127097 TaxID=3347136 RepID=UPI00365B12DB